MFFYLRTIMNKSATPSIKPVIYWLFTGCFLIYAMVVIGGLTRLTHSGLSMVNWSVFGSTPPFTTEDWQGLFEKYKHYPEYQQINFNFSLSEFKQIFWWEFSHRLLARCIAVIFILPFAWFWFKGYFNKALLKRLWIIVLLGALQGLLGWYMVKSGLSKEPRVSHIRLAAHLISAFTVFGFTFWTALTLIYPNSTSITNQDETLPKPYTTLPKSIKPLSIALLAIVVFQIIYGAFVAGLHAGLICPTWPKMCGEWLHDSVMARNTLAENFLYNPAGVQWVHRWIAALVVIAVLLLNRYLTHLPQHLKSIVFWLNGMVIAQFILGVLTLINLVPVSLGVLHQTGAFFLFTLVLFWNYNLFNNSKN